MKKTSSLIALLTLAAAVAGGCATCRNAIESERTLTRTDSVRIVTRTVMVPVKVSVDVPPIRELRRGLRDSVSVLENEFAVSTVVLHPDGSFDHGLETRPHRIERQTEVPVQSSDTMAVSKTAEESVRTETRVVETNVLRWYQKALIWAGAAALCALAAVLAYRLFKHRLKGVFTAIKLLDRQNEQK
ncbi:MAG: hypothetical protein KBS67_05500 [Bacteroidales bacterium]|nr:hypothetical protein [Candidatus Cryptobacteroides equifaecalis]